jgi:beta-xylosidase
MPDPFVLRVGSEHFAYATGSSFKNVQLRRSTDLRTWSDATDVLPELPAWADWGFTWAPSVLRRSEDYALFYTARHRPSGRQCISVATAPVPDGPFRDTSQDPLVCQVDRGGSIDPDPFVDIDGTTYLLWKSDDNALGRKTAIWSQRLDPSSLTLTGEPVTLLKQDRAWEVPLVEGPAMVRAAGSYFLFYGAGWWESSSAAIGYAVCETPLSGCSKKTRKGPWLASSSVVSGPAGPAFFTGTDGKLRIAYHGWTPGRVGYAIGGHRSLWIDRVDIVDGVPRIV